MSFGDTFWKVWEVRTSIRIQDSIENFFRGKSDTFIFEEVPEAVVKAQISWNQKLEQSRSHSSRKVRTLNCDYCNNRFNILIQEKELNTFSGFAFYRKVAYRINENTVVRISEILESDSCSNPLFYCSKKCILSDRSIEIIEFKMGVS